MATRRVFLQGAAAVSAAVAVPTYGQKAYVASNRALALIDRLSQEGQRFASAMVACGVPVIDIGGDPGKVWYGSLAPRLKREVSSLIGFSSHGALFCLERLAWDVGLRVRMRIEHRPLADAGWSHDSHSAVSRLAAQRLSGVSDFVPAVARLAMECHMGLEDCTHAAPLHLADQTGNALVTWVLAPSAPIDGQRL